MKANVASGTAAACRRVVRPLPALERRRRRLQPEPGEAAVHVLKARDGSDAAGDVERDRAWKRIRTAARKFDVEIEADNWRDLFKGGKAKKR